jgi:AraC-like DNA-binding protein
MGGRKGGAVLRSLFISSVEAKPEPPEHEAFDGFTLNDPDMYDAFVTVHDACDRDTPPDDASCQVAELLLALTTRYPNPAAAAAIEAAGAQRRAVHEGITRAREYVRAHLGERLTLDVLAGIACLSPFHFTRTFRDAVGLTPHAYVLHTRLARAQTLLAAQLPVSEVAYGTGFADQSHLTHAFRRQFGCTPARYARAARRIMLDGFPLAA